MNFKLEGLADYSAINYANFLYQGFYINLILSSAILMDDHECGLNMRNVNEFSSQNGQWTNEILYEKAAVKSYSYCMITIAVEFRPSGRASYELTVFLFKVLGKKFDFIPIFKLYKFGEYDSMLKLSPMFEYHIKEYRTLLLHYGDFQYYILSNNEIALLVSIGEPYGIFEKLMLPFDSVTWMLIMSCFFVAFFVIFQMRWWDPSIQSFLYGSHVTTPALNILGAFLVKVKQFYLAETLLDIC